MSNKSLRQWLLILSPLLLPLLYRHGLRVRPFFRWYDLWVGVYVDTASRSVYVCPIPMLGIKMSLHDDRHQTRRVPALNCGSFMPLGANVTMLESGDLSFDEAHDHVHRSEYTVRHDTEVGYYLDGQMAVKFE